MTMIHEVRSGVKATFDRTGSASISKSSTASTLANQPVEEALDAEGGLPTTVTEKAKTDIDEPPPNGGLHAWLAVLGSFFLFFNCW